MPNYYVVICCTWFALPEEIHQPEAGDNTWSDLTSAIQSNKQTPQCLPMGALVSRVKVASTFSVPPTQPCY